MFSLARLWKRREAVPPRILLTNTLSGAKELFVPLKRGVATMYSCGPTVYDRASIGNLRAYVFADTLARVLIEAGYHLRRVINITDVGHLVGDGDFGEDKMALGARREATTPEVLAERYTKRFLEDIEELNIDVRTILFPRATEYLREQIAMAKALEEKGFAYRAPDGLYFDTKKFPGYGRLGGADRAQARSHARVPPAPGKRSANDFALWRLAKEGDLQQWDSPWGRGNPGWSIECSAMARTLLGVEVDLHTGGQDHVAVHHNNEIAQSESANGHRFVRYWLHNAFLTVEGEKISKSLGNVFYLSDIVARGYEPLALRYFFLQAHYRSPLSFSWNALAAADEALARLWRLARETAKASRGAGVPSRVRERFLALVRDDLATPAALALLWESLRSDELLPREQWGILESAEHIFGLSLTAPPADARAVREEDVPAEIKRILARREAAREARDYATADALRAELERWGYSVDDAPRGPVLSKRTG